MGSGLLVAEFGSDFKHLSHPPTLQLAEMTGFHNFNFVTQAALILFIMCVHNRLTLNLFFVEWVRNFVGVGDFDRLIAGATGDDSDEGLARIACDGFHIIRRLKSLCAGGSQLLFFKDGFETRDLAAHFFKFVWVLDLAGLLAHAEVDAGITCIAKLFFDFGFGHFADFFSAHSIGFLCKIIMLLRGKRSGSGMGAWCQQGGVLHERL